MFYSLFLEGTRLLLKIGRLTLAVGKSNVKCLQKHANEETETEQNKPDRYISQDPKCTQHKDNCTKIIMFTDL